MALNAPLRSLRFECLGVVSAAIIVLPRCVEAQSDSAFAVAWDNVEKGSQLRVWSALHDYANERVRVLHRSGDTLRLHIISRRWDAPEPVLIGQLDSARLRIKERRGGAETAGGAAWGLLGGTAKVLILALTCNEFCAFTSVAGLGSGAIVGAIVGAATVHRTAIKWRPLRR